jgi:hypothetical protein
LILCIFYSMTHPGGNTDRITCRYRENPAAKGHAAGAGQDMIELLTVQVSMQPGHAAGPDGCLGKTLVAVTVQIRVHEFPNLGTIKGCIWFHIVPATSHVLFPFRKPYAG